MFKTTQYLVFHRKLYKVCASAQIQFDEKFTSIAEILLIKMLFFCGKTVLNQENAVT